MSPAVTALLGAMLFPPPAIDPTKASAYFTEARRLSDADAGKLWGVRLDGPILLADPATHCVVANIADADKKLESQGNVYIGKLPSSIAPSNTSLDWSGTKWTMIVWPLPSDEQDRASLMMHECFHRIQDRIGLRATDPSNAHLDTLEGRVWLQLEWRALAKALDADRDARRAAVRDAL